VPLADLLMAARQLVMVGKEKIFEHSEQVEIHEARQFTQQKKAGAAAFARMEPGSPPAVEQALRLRAPLVDAVRAELAFLVTDEGKPGRP